MGELTLSASRPRGETQRWGLGLSEIVRPREETV